MFMAQKNREASACQQFWAFKRRS